MNWCSLGPHLTSCHGDENVCHYWWCTHFTRTSGSRYRLIEFKNLNWLWKCYIESWQYITRLSKHPKSVDKINEAIEVTSPNPACSAYTTAIPSTVTVSIFHLPTLQKSKLCKLPTNKTKNSQVTMRPFQIPELGVMKLLQSEQTRT